MLNHSFQAGNLAAWVSKWPFHWTEQTSLHWHSEVIAYKELLAFEVLKWPVIFHQMHMGLILTTTLNCQPRLSDHDVKNKQYYSAPVQCFPRKISVCFQYEFSDTDWESNNSVHTQYVFSAWPLTEAKTQNVIYRDGSVGGRQLTVDFQYCSVMFSTCLTSP